MSKNVLSVIGEIIIDRETQINLLFTIKQKGQEEKYKTKASNFCLRIKNSFIKKLCLRLEKLLFVMAMPQKINRTIELYLTLMSDLSKSIYGLLLDWFFCCCFISFFNNMDS